MSRCRGCGAEISWIRMKSGKMIPVDPSPTFIVDGTGTDVVVTSDGIIANGIPCPGEPPAGKRLGWVSHFATCPMAGRFRRRDG